MKPADATWRNLYILALDERDEARTVSVKLDKGYPLTATEHENLTLWGLEYPREEGR